MYSMSKNAEPRLLELQPGDQVKISSRCANAPGGAGRPHTGGVGAAAGGLDVLLQQVQQRDRVRQPVRQTRVVLLLRLDLQVMRRDS